MKRLLLAAILLIAGVQIAAAQTAAPVLPGYLSTSGCTGPSPCYLPYSNANPLPTSATISGTVTATTAATASASPTAVAAGTGKPINISTAGSELFTSISIGGTIVPAGHGTAATALRVELPTDGTGVVGLNAGSAIVGKVGVDQTTPGTTNAVQPIPGTSGGLSLLSKQVANNTTSFAVDASPGQLYGIEAFNNSATIAYIKLYNAAQGSTTCGSGTPVYRGMIPSNSTSGAGYVSANLMGIPFGTAITACVTTGFADNDTTAPAATTYIVNFTYR